jgi:phosphomannomutase
VKDGQKEGAIERFADAKFKNFLDWPIVRREDMDGVKVYLGGAGWAMVRASGTEPMLRIYAETNHAETTRLVLDEVTAFVRKL